jgi:hypothetical protein
VNTVVICGTSFASKERVARSRRTREATQMKSNPFYAVSASAMLLGCWLLGEALHLQAGQLGGLLVLMSVLQLYEGLLVGLGSFLVRTGRAPRDGVTVLVLESIFLMDAPLLAAECVTANARVGTGVACALAALAAAKLACVRRTTPELLTKRAAALLGAQAVVVLALPVTAAHLAWARVFGPVALYGVWWATLVLPAAQRALRRETRAAEASPSRWTWVPTAMTLLHLWAVGYIHTIDFRPAFLAPMLLGLALTAGHEQLARQVALPGLAVLVSLGQGSTLGIHAPGWQGVVVSPLHLALVGVAATWGYLAWRDRARWLAVLALGSGLAGSLGASAPHLADALARALRRLAFLVPPDGFGWGVLTVIAAYVFLAAGARRSLFGSRRSPLAGGGPAAPLPRRARESAAVALALAVLALTAAVSVLDAGPLGHPQQNGLAALASIAAAAAIGVALRAHGRAACLENDPAGRRLAGLAMAVGAFAVVLALTTFTALSLDAGHSRRNVRAELRMPIETSRTAPRACCSLV